MMGKKEDGLSAWLFRTRSFLARNNDTEAQGHWLLTLFIVDAPAFSC